MQSKGGSGQMQGWGLLSAHFTFVFVAAEVVWLCCATFTLKGRSHTHTWREGCCISCYKYSTNEKHPANPSADRHLGAAVQTNVGWAMADLSLSILCQLNPMEHQEDLTQATKAAPFLPWKLGMLHYGTCFSLTQRNIPGSNSNKNNAANPQLRSGECSWEDALPSLHALSAVCKAAPSPAWFPVLGWKEMWSFHVPQMLIFVTYRQPGKKEEIKDSLW